MVSETVFEYDLSFEGHLRWALMKRPCKQNICVVVELTRGALWTDGLSMQSIKEVCKCGPHVSIYRPFSQWVILRSYTPPSSSFSTVMSHKAYTGSTKTVGEVYEDIYREFMEDANLCETFRDKKPSMLRSHWDQLQQPFSSWRQAHEQEKTSSSSQAPASEEERLLVRKRATCPRAGGVVSVVDLEGRDG